MESMQEAERQLNQINQLKDMVTVANKQAEISKVGTSCFCMKLEQCTKRKAISINPMNCPM